MNRFWTCAKGFLHARQTAPSKQRLLHARLFSMNNGPCFKSHYEVLGVPTSATKKEIRDGYIKNSKLYHPDNDPSDPTLHQKFVAVQQAYDILSSDEKRQAYDARNIHYAHRSSSASSSYSQHTASWGDHEKATKEQMKNRAFWTDPEYHRRDPETRKVRFFGREFEAKEANRLTVVFTLLWMTIGTAFVYVYTKYAYGRRQYEVLESEKQKRISQEYSSMREEAMTTSRAEAMERIKERMKVKADEEKNDDEDDR